MGPFLASRKKCKSEQMNEKKRKRRPKRKKRKERKLKRGWRQKMTLCLGEKAQGQSILGGDLLRLHAFRLLQGTNHPPIIHKYKAAALQTGKKPNAAAVSFQLPNKWPCQLNGWCICSLEKSEQASSWGLKGWERRQEQPTHMRKASFPPIPSKCFSSLPWRTFAREHGALLIVNLAVKEIRWRALEKDPREDKLAHCYLEVLITPVSLDQLWFQMNSRQNK